MRHVTDAQVQAALQGWIAVNQVPATTSNTLYFIFLPPGVVSELGSAQSCVAGGYCGYHNEVGAVYYAVIPFVNCNGCTFPGQFLDTLTEVSSHELAEAITDPALNAWFDPATGDEIGDICNRQTVRLGGYLVQTEWSNAQQACAVAPPVPYGRRILEVATTFADETDGIWCLADYDHDGVPDLVFIKTSNTPNGHVEVHVASGKSNYQTRILEVATTFADETDGTWCLADYDHDGVPDLVFIKTSNTPNGHVEVHVASGKSNYQTRILEVATTFADETDGIWCLADYDHDGVPDLVFIKTSNTPNGHVEVHVASGKSNYQTRILEVATTFADETDGIWCLADYDHDGVPDLVFIKTSNTPNGHVEVHVASGKSNYQTRILEVATTFADETDGTWCLADYDHDGVPDLVFIKTSNTPNGHVEVHVAAGG